MLACHYAPNGATACRQGITQKLNNGGLYCVFATVKEFLTPTPPYKYSHDYIQAPKHASKNLSGYVRTRARAKTLPEDKLGTPEHARTDTKRNAQ